MLIRSKLIRPDGTHVVLGKGADARKYHFKPLDPKKPDVDHACEVESQEDIATFLAIKEGYEIHPTEIKAKKPAAPAPAPAASAPAGGDNTDPGAGAPAKTATDYDKLSKPDLIALVTERVGKKPHPSTSTAKMVQTLKDLDAAAK